MFTIKSRNWVLFAVLLGTLCFSTLVMAAVEVELKLDDPANPKALVIESNDSKCNGTILDCIEVAVNDSPHLFFYLKNACKASGPQYKLMTFKITQVDKAWPTVGNPLNLWVANDFYADPKTGIVDLSAGKNKLRDAKIKLKNFNTREYTIYYEISAKHCTDNTKADIYLDPEIRNKGNN